LGGSAYIIGRNLATGHSFAEGVQAAKNFVDDMLQKAKDLISAATSDPKNKDQKDPGNGKASTPARGLPPDGVSPPVSGDVKPGSASRPSEKDKGGQSLWDKNGGEWRYFPGDEYHNPHWDFNPHNAPNSAWQNVPINGLSPEK
jgi:hypothetical protein